MNTAPPNQRPQPNQTCAPMHTTLQRQLPTQTQTPLPTHVHLANLLQLLLRNALATSLALPRPCTINHCNHLRAHLLADPFFDPTHLPHEIPSPLIRPSKILFSDLVVLMARVLRVLMRQQQQQGNVYVLGAALTEEEEEEERAERGRVRWEALCQPFFERGREGGGNPFSDGGVVDEGCVL
ncbi:hypothetical protein B0A55_11386 [Friedmanniomyces simplex]|uniref:Uncharacterized protein n=1 Tax=Friedmanniomyces simplex TaxID=329884 RepID=A0A4U0WRR8_9PEZI|nr:hypothetical protein B0A55_11386 [Friedmanniomyces simplex]